jgi:hypothetical protein
VEGVNRSMVETDAAGDAQELPELDVAEVEYISLLG